MYCIVYKHCAYERAASGGNNGYDPFSNLRKAAGAGGAGGSGQSGFLEGGFPFATLEDALRPAPT